jgi:lysophospholipase L1-like esterase
MLKAGGDFKIDDIAMQSYFRLIDKLHQRGIRILFVVPPTSTPLLTPKFKAFEHYQALITPHMAAGDLLLDFNSAEYASLRDDPENYTDGVHMRPTAARAVVAAIDRELGNLRRP